MKTFYTLSVLLSLCLGACSAPTPLALMPLAPTPLAPTPLAPAPTDPPPSTTAALTLTLTPTPTPTPTPTSLPTPVPPPVLIISIDGLRPDVLTVERAPHIMALAQRGAYSWQAQATFRPITLPSHASMLCGCLPETHHITWNNYEPERGFIEVPTVFSVAHAAGLRTVMVVGKEKFAHFNVPGTLDAYRFVEDGDQAVADAAVSEAEAGFDVMFVHLPNMDYFGHRSGWLSDDYLNALPRTDEAVARVLAAVPTNTIIILTADHGGHDQGHGRDIPEDMTIPWVIAGPGVLSNHALTGPILTTATGATALYVLGLSRPETMTGEPVWEAFGLAP